MAVRLIREPLEADISDRVKDLIDEGNQVLIGASTGGSRELGPVFRAYRAAVDLDRGSVHAWNNATVAAICATLPFAQEYAASALECERVAAVLYNAGVACMTTGPMAVSSARSFFSESVDKRWSAAALVGKATGELVLGENENAQATAGVAIRETDDSELRYDALNVQGIALDMLGEESKDCFNRAVRIEPSSAAAYVNRGFCKASRQDYKGAERDFTKAIARNPAYAPSYFNRALVRVKLLNTAGFQEDLLSAVERDSRMMSVLDDFVAHKRGYFNALELRPQLIVLDVVR